MSFLHKFTHNINPYKKIVHSNRKERKDSLVAKIKKSQITLKTERASVFTSKGSLTVEAAIAVPIFFFAVLCLAYLLEIMAVQTTVRSALFSAGREAAQKVYVNTFLSHNELERQLVDTIGAEQLDKSIIADGARGFDCSESKCNWSTGVLELSVRYRINIPILMFRIQAVKCDESLRIKGWNGYVTTIGSTEKEDTVYVTETGIVYHRDAKCTYLDMSVRTVRRAEVEKLRNQSGGKYYACESCGKQKKDDLYYITDYGTRYHTTLDCNKIKRNVYAISLEEAYGLRGCSKCVK